MTESQTKRQHTGKIGSFNVQWLRKLNDLFVLLMQTESQGSDKNVGF